MSRKRTPLPKEPTSTLYVVASACAAAAVLGLTIFLLVRGIQWQRALSDLRAEPGIEVLSVERSGFFKKRLRGLRDPLAPPVEAFLRRHQIGPHAAELVFAEYHSLNTPYAEEREAESLARTEAWRDTLAETVAQFARELSEQRQADLETFTRLLLETRFPDAMAAVALEWEEGACHPVGELYAPLYEPFVAGAPECFAEGEMRFDRLVNLTVARTSALRAEIESADLLATDLDGGLVHFERVLRLLADYDEVCDLSDLPRPRIHLRVVAGAPGGEPPEALVRLRRLIAARAWPEPERWGPERSSVADATGEGVSAFLQIEAAESP